VAVKQGTRKPDRARPARSQSRPAAARDTLLSPHDAALDALREPAPRVPLGGRDLLPAGTAAVVAALVYLSTFSSHVALGDAPESVAGVRSLGILHAPGYPSYVLAARAFGDVFAFGSWAGRVNAFSLVCAAAAVGVVTLIARACGASRAGAAVGALALATTASFWLNAGFAKYYAFTTLLLALTILLALVWQERGGRGWLIAAGGVLALALGSGWELAAIVIVVVAVMLNMSERRPTRRDLGAAFGMLVVVATAVWVFLVVRAGQHPTLNWGDASSLGGLVHLVLRRDFAGVNGPSGGTPTNVFGRLAGMSGGVARDFGAAAMLLALVAAVFWRHIRREVRALVLVGVLLNLVGVAIDSGLGQINGFLSVISQGGYLLVLMIFVAVLTALGVTTITDYLRVREQTRASAPSEYARARATPSRLPAAVAAVCAIAVVVPSVIVHRSRAELRSPAFADIYGQRMLNSLPHHAVLLVWGSEYAMPMIYRQVVHHERPDVSVVAADDLAQGWGREQIGRQLHLGTIHGATLADIVKDVVTETMKSRPVYLDVFSMNAMEGLTGYQTEGLVAKAVPGAVGFHAPPNVNALANQLVHLETVDHMNNQEWDRPPFQVAFWERARAHIELAKVYALQKNTAGVLRELRRAEAIFPVVPNVPTAIDYIVNEHANPFNVVADL
jgi:hypothetical protein